jgi:hypothetical protein
MMSVTDQEFTKSQRSLCNRIAKELVITKTSQAKLEILVSKVIVQNYSFSFIFDEFLLIQRRYQKLRLICLVVSSIIRLHLFASSWSVRGCEKATKRSR